MKLYLQELPNPILPIRYIPLPIQDNVDYSFQVFQSLPYVTQKFLCDMLPLFTTIIENSSRTCHSSQTIAMCLAPSFIGRYSNRADSLAVAIRYTRNLIEQWPQIDDRLAEYSDSDSDSCSEDESTPLPRPPKPSSSSSEHTSAFRISSHHNIRAVNSHQDVSNSIDSFPGIASHKAQVRSFSTASTLTTGKVVNVFSDTQTGQTIRASGSISSVSSGEAHSISTGHSSTDGKALSKDYLTTAGTPPAPPPPPPPPPKLRKSASTILRPTNSTSSLSGASSSAPSLPSPTLNNRPQLSTRSSYSGDLNQNWRSGKAAATAKRGRMVAELAKLYEEKSLSGPQPAVLLELDKSKSNILS